MLFLEQRGEFLVATIKHGLQTPKSPPITIIKKQQFQVLSSRILRKWFEKPWRNGGVSRTILKQM